MIRGAAVARDVAEAVTDDDVADLSAYPVRANERIAIDEDLVPDPELMVRTQKSLRSGVTYAWPAAVTSFRTVIGTPGQTSLSNSVSENGSNDMFGHSVGAASTMPSGVTGTGERHDDSGRRPELTVELAPQLFEERNERREPIAGQPKRSARPLSVGHNAVECQS